MAQYALVGNELATAAGLGIRGVCHDPKCGWEMVAKPGNGKTVPHWAHMPGSRCVEVYGTGMNEWHKEVQDLFERHGATITGITMRSADGSQDHVPDVVLADGRIVEAQTAYMSEADIASREATYGDMCWIYDAMDSHAWFVIDDPRRPDRFAWGKPDRRFFAHTKPIYFDTPDGFWKLAQLHVRYGKGGKAIYDGVRVKVADDLLDFVRKTSAGRLFGPPARMSIIDPKKTRGTRLRTPQPVDEWLAANPECYYTPDVVEVPPALPPATHTDWSLLAGMTCCCPSGCTDVRWGDHGTCAPGCHPCHLMAGTVYTSPRQKAAA